MWARDEDICLYNKLPDTAYRYIFASPLSAQILQVGTDINDLSSKTLVLTLEEFDTSGWSPTILPRPGDGLHMLIRVVNLIFDRRFMGLAPVVHIYLPGYSAFVSFIPRTSSSYESLRVRRSSEICFMEILKSTLPKAKLCEVDINLLIHSEEKSRDYERINARETVKDKFSCCHVILFQQ